MVKENNRNDNEKKINGKVESIKRWNRYKEKKKMRNRKRDI